ncbi:MAG: hypothetical protein M0Z27_13060 [Thermaerobacter sp.]|nr:hypothetical protein [Thermaerobacter sp.]
MPNGIRRAAGILLTGLLLLGAATGCSFLHPPRTKTARRVSGAPKVAPKPTAASPAAKLYEAYAAQAPKLRWFVRFAHQKGAGSDQLLVGQPMFAQGTRFVRVTVTPADTKYVYNYRNEELKLLAVRYHTTVTGIIAANGCYLGWPQAYIRIWISIPPAQNTGVFNVKAPVPSNC